MWELAERVCNSNDIAKYYAFTITFKVTGVAVAPFAKLFGLVQVIVTGPTTVGEPDGTHVHTLPVDVNPV